MTAASDAVVASTGRAFSCCCCCCCCCVVALSSVAGAAAASAAEEVVDDVATSPTTTTASKFCRPVALGEFSANTRTLKKHKKNIIMHRVTIKDSTHSFAINDRFKVALCTMPYGIVLPSSSHTHLTERWNSHLLRQLAGYENRSIFEYVSDSLKTVTDTLAVPPKHNLATDYKSKVNIKRFFDNAHYKLLEQKKHHLKQISYWLPVICEVGYSPRLLAENFQKDVQEVGFSDFYNI